MARGTLDDRRHDGSGGDELQQRVEERFAVVLGVVLAGQLVADVPQLKGRNRQALALDPADYLADQAPLDAVGLDQYQGPLSHGRQRTCASFPNK